MSGVSRRWVRVLVIAAALLGTARDGGVSGRPGPVTTTSVATTRSSPGSGDPSAAIPGIVRVDYPSGMHTEPGQRVAYDRSPPFGGPHDAIWADCAGIVYRTPVRNEHMVHALEHGTVWIAYNPAQVTGRDLDQLKRKVDGNPYLMLSPYPNLDRPVSVQSWGHQLKLDRADDQRIGEFIDALRANPRTTPEPGARCDPADPSVFDATDPPPFDPSPPGPDAMPVTPR
jgi:hypothetical protein